MYLSTPLEEGWIYSKNHFIKPVWLDKPIIASVAVINNKYAS